MTQGMTIEQKLKSENRRNISIAASLGVGTATAIGYNAIADEPTPTKCLIAGTIGTIVGYVGSEIVHHEINRRNAQEKEQQVKAQLTSGVAEVNRQLEQKTAESIRQVSTLPTPNTIKAPSIPPIPKKP